MGLKAVPGKPRLFWRGPVLVYIDQRGGRQQQKSLGRDKVRAFELYRALELGELKLDSTKLTVDGAADLWYPRMVCSERHANDIRSRFDRGFRIEYGRTKLRDLQRRHLRDFRTLLEKRNLSVPLIRHTLSDVRTFINWCIDAEYLEHSPVPRKWLPQKPKNVPKRLSREEAQRAAKIAEPYGFYMRFLLATGLRWGEFITVSTADVWNGVLVVERSKTNTVSRIPLSAATLKELAGREGKLCHLTAAQDLAKHVRKLAKIPAFHVHQTRHTFASEWLEAGGSLKALQILLGHSSITTTMVYATLDDAHVEAEARRMHGKGKEA